MGYKDRQIIRVPCQTGRVLCVYGIATVNNKNIERVSTRRDELTRLGKGHVSYTMRHILVAAKSTHIV